MPFQQYDWLEKSRQRPSTNMIGNLEILGKLKLPCHFVSAPFNQLRICLGEQKAKKTFKDGNKNESESID